VKERQAWRLRQAAVTYCHSRPNHKPHDRRFFAPLNTGRYLDWRAQIRPLRARRVRSATAPSNCSDASLAGQLGLNPVRREPARL